MRAQENSVPGETPVIELRGLNKSYGAVQAVLDMDAKVKRGEIHALVGENGAGKSTVGKMIAGVVEPTAGRILLDGVEVRFHTPRDAIRQGIAMMDQELAMLPARSVLDNVFLGGEESRRGLLNLSAQRERFLELCEVSGFSLDPTAIVGRLSVAEQQKVEILRAIARDARVIVMDEPTAALDADEAGHLHGLIRGLRQDGTTIILVSHFLEEVLEIADTVTVMRDGEVAKTAPAKEETVTSLVGAMLGRSVDLAFPPIPSEAVEADPVLEVTALTGTEFSDISFELRPGEIVGLAGLVGSGRSELARALFGAAEISGGSILVEGEEVALRSPRSAVRRGIALVPESRKEDGLVMLRSVRENLGLATLDRHSRIGFTSSRAEGRAVSETIDRLSIRTDGTEIPVDALSGGNQQKVMFGKWLMANPRVLLLDEPTRGVDVGAKLSIYELIRELADAGMAVLLISSEMEEVIGLSQRVLVMHRGRLTASLSAQEATSEAVLQAACGAEAVA